MFRIFIILMILGGLFWSGLLSAAPCEGNRGLVVTSPRSGAVTYYESIAVRGFLCRDYDYVIVRNTTTSEMALADTQKTCDHERCSYTFIILMEDLAWGLNEFTASIPYEDPPVEFDFEVTRTALALVDPLEAF